MIEPTSLRDKQNGPGVVEWIGLRPGRREPLQEVRATEARAGRGLDGDHFSGKPGSKRQVTLVQWEHLAVVASILGVESIDPLLLRRNVVVRGVNLLALVERRFRIGEAVLEGASACHPCSRMEENLGNGGWNAMRGHGGITARIIESGRIRVGDAVVDLGAAPDADPGQLSVSS